MTDTADVPDAQRAHSRSPVGVWPTFRYHDAKAAIAFLTNVLGFQETVVYTDDEDSDRVLHAELRWPLGGGIMLGSERESAEWPSGVGQGSAYVVTDDPDALYAMAVEAGVTGTQELAHQDYGSREFAIRDPEGNHWSFGTYPGA